MKREGKGWGWGVGGRDGGKEEGGVCENGGVNEDGKGSDEKVKVLSGVAKITTLF